MWSANMEKILYLCMNKKNKILINRIMTTFTQYQQQQQINRTD